MLLFGTVLSANKRSFDFYYKSYFKEFQYHSAGRALEAFRFYSGDINVLGVDFLDHPMPKNVLAKELAQTVGISYNFNKSINNYFQLFIEGDDSNIQFTDIELQPSTLVQNTGYENPLTSLISIGNFFNGRISPGLGNQLSSMLLNSFVGFVPIAILIFYAIIFFIFRCFCCTFLCRPHLYKYRNSPPACTGFSLVFNLVFFLTATITFFCASIKSIPCFKEFDNLDINSKYINTYFVSKIKKNLSVLYDDLIAVDNAAENLNPVTKEEVGQFLRNFPTNLMRYDDGTFTSQINLIKNEIDGNINAHTEEITNLMNSGTDIKKHFNAFSRPDTNKNLLPGPFSFKFDTSKPFDIASAVGIKGFTDKMQVLKIVFPLIISVLCIVFLFMGFFYFCLSFTDITHKWANCCRTWDCPFPFIMFLITTALFVICTFINTDLFFQTNEDRYWFDTYVEEVEKRNGFSKITLPSIDFSKIIGERTKYVFPEYDCDSYHCVMNEIKQIAWTLNESLSLSNINNKVVQRTLDLIKEIDGSEAPASHSQLKEEAEKVIIERFNQQNDIFYEISYSIKMAMEKEYDLLGCFKQYVYPLFADYLFALHILRESLLDIAFGCIFAMLGCLICGYISAHLRRFYGMIPNDEILAELRKSNDNTSLLSSLFARQDIDTVTWIDFDPATKHLMNKQKRGHYDIMEHPEALFGAETASTFFADPSFVL